MSTLYLSAAASREDTQQRNHVYFTIYYNFDSFQNTLAVTHEMLQPRWFFNESHQKFTQGKTIYERANVITEKNYQSQVKQQLPEVYRIIQRLEREINKDIDNGHIHFNPNAESKFWITDQANGRKLDTEQLCKDIITILKSGAHGELMASINDLIPDTPEEILSRIVTRSQYSTNFSDNAPREGNIELALKAFDGLTVKPNERVSFNEVVGRRTKERGYQEAKIIVDGEFVPGTGGGVCQASTTIFNAALLSGLRITESHNHSIPISYVPLGRDAMVSSAADLAFVNNTASPIYIETTVVDKGKTNTAIVRIYGERASHTYKTRVEVEALEQEETTSGEVPSQMQGFDYEVGGPFMYEKKIVQQGYPPRLAKTYLDVYKDGNIIDSKLIRKSRYKGKEQLVTYERTELVEITPQADQQIRQRHRTRFGRRVAKEVSSHQA